MQEEVKTYLRIDGSEDDAFLTSLISAAKIYLKNATGFDVDDTNDLHKLAVNLLVAHSYENRLPIGQGEKLAFSLESIITQMKYCYIATPTGLNAFVVDGVIDLIWDANTESNLAGYKVYQNSTEIGTVVTNSYQVSGLVGGTYSFQVLAFDDSNTQSKLSKPVSVEVV